MTIWRWEEFFRCDKFSTTPARYSDGPLFRKSIVQIGLPATVLKFGLRLGLGLRLALRLGLRLVGIETFGIADPNHRMTVRQGSIVMR